MAKSNRKLVFDTSKEGNFMSVEDLKCKITDCIKYHNLQPFMQIEWTFTGFYKDKPLAA
jgi:hypothetical protein